MTPLRNFANYVAELKGDEKSEAQSYILHLLAAFGHEGMELPEGSRFEYRVRFQNQRVKFADFVWGDRVLIEMKSRGEKLTKHYQQTFDYWLHLVPHRPAYVILCNFDELWVFDFNTQLQDPMDKIRVEELVAKQAALAFLKPDGGKPFFQGNAVDVTREAARQVAKVFRSLVKRGEDRVRSRRWILQSVVSMFSEDVGLLPPGLFTSLLADCLKGKSTYDELGALFRQMDNPVPARAGRFKGVDYFNGGLFSVVDPIELTKDELEGLYGAAHRHKWSAVQPAIFGTLFQDSLETDEQHLLGAHFTSEADIQKIIRPTIVRPWEERIAAAKNVPQLIALLKELRAFRVLDPACGSGNFLFVAYRALRELEQRLLLRLFAQDRRLFKKIGLSSGISPSSFHGIDLNETAIEVAKVTLMLARRLAHAQADEFWTAHEDDIPGLDTQELQLEKDLPLDNLDKTIVCADALFMDWPEVDTIVGNPPYQSKNKMQEEFGAAYIRKVRRQYPEVPGHADFCVYWFRKAHDTLKAGQRAGLVGTKTIRQNYSRIGGLDHIVNNGGTITEAVSNQVWSGSAVVHVAIVNWAKADIDGPKTLFEQQGDRLDSPWKQWMLDRIPSSLTAEFDVTQAVRLDVNARSPLCEQGQTPGHKDFLITDDQAKDYLKDARNADVIFPYMIGKTDLLGEVKPKPSRWIIDFSQREMTEAASYKRPFEHVQALVLPKRQAVALQEKKRNKELEDEVPDEEGNRHHERFLNQWWQLSWPRPSLMKRISQLDRYIVCVQVTKRPVFEFVSSTIHPSNALIVFATADDYTFGILQSSIHWEWFTARCSSLKRDPRYTSETVFNTFPWPTASKAQRSQLLAVAEAGRKFREVRSQVMRDNEWCLRQVHKTFELPGTNKVKDALEVLDAAVKKLYGIGPKANLLEFLFNLNQAYATKEVKGVAVQAPGLPPDLAGDRAFYSKDCIMLDD